MYSCSNDNILKSTQLIIIDILRIQQNGVGMINS